MRKKCIQAIFFSLSLLLGNIKVSFGELDNRGGLWYLKGSEYPFNGIAYKMDNNTKIMIQQTNFIDGLEWGKYYEWWPDGTKKVDGKYRSGLMYGRWKFFSNKGKIFCAGSYLNGKGHKPPSLIDNVPSEGVRGLWTYWDENGRKIEEGYFSKNGSAKGNWSYWDKNGKKSLGKKINYKTFNNIDAIKHLDGFFLVSGPINIDNLIYSKAHGAIRGGKLDGPWSFWGSNGQLLSTKNYENGVPFGRYSTYSENGLKIIDGVVKGIDKSGKIVRDGEWKFWDSKGRLKEEVAFVDGKREGLTTYYSVNGKESAKILYKNNLPWNGEWVTWYNDGSKKESGMYIDGVKQGSWKGWFKNGQKKFVLTYKNNFKHGLYTEWGNDGRLRKDIEYNEGSPISEYIVEYSGEGYTEINRRNGELSGSWIKWYSNGKKSEEGVYKYGEKGGLWTGWYENETKKYQARYKNGKIDGLYTEFDEKGRMIKNINYNNGEILSEYHLSLDYSGSTEFHKKNGVLHGKWVRRYANGDTAEEGNYYYGEKQGQWIGWYRTNEKQFTCDFDNGVKVGTYKQWNKNGEIEKQIDYYSGKRVKEYLVIQDENGYMEINKVNGILDGSWVKWYSKGKKEEEGFYQKGIKTGTWSRYNVTGLLIEELNYDNKGRNLYEITYYTSGTVKEYRDYFSKTVQEYNIDGSKKGKTTPF